MGTPRIMVRFRDETNPAVEAHNAIFNSKGRVFWGLWLKAFEDEKAIKNKLRRFNRQTIYIADTASKAKPSIYVCDVKRVLLTRRAVNPSLVPKYYRKKIPEVPIWFELVSQITEIDADPTLGALLGVPTIYFLKYDSKGVILSEGLQREFQFTAAPAACYVLHLSDIHLGSDHAFRYPLPEDQINTTSTHTLTEVLVADLRQTGAFGKIGCVVISGDIVTKGGWSESTEIGGKPFSGLDLAQLCLDDLSEKIGVPRDLFFMVPGNHDVVRQSKADPAVVQEFLLHYKHEIGFRTLREEFSQIYRLSPLNYVARVAFQRGTVVFGLLNSAYLNEKADFSEYGFVGD